MRRANKLVPASQVEKEALSTLRSFLTPFATGDSPWGDFPAMSPAASRVMRGNMVELMLLGMWQTTSGRMIMIESAKAGYGPAIDYLRIKLLDYDSRGVVGMPPTEVAGYAQWLKWLGREPDRERDPGKMGHFNRDLGIALAVEAVLIRHPELHPTGRSARRRSACNLVSEALGGFGLAVGEVQVRKIWERLGPHVRPIVAMMLEAMPK